MILLKVGEFLGLPGQIIARFLPKTRANQAFSGVHSTGTLAFQVFQLERLKSVFEQG